MSLPVEPIYLVIQDAALRSSLSAWLGLSGHLIVALPDLASLKASRPNANGLFVLEDALLPHERDTWPDLLGPLPAGRCMVLAGDDDAPHATVTVADRRGALPAIEMMIARIEAAQLDG